MHILYIHQQLRSSFNTKSIRYMEQMLYSLLITH